MSESNDKWLIWSNEHGAWWLPNGNGYTNDVAAAGRYDLAEARHVCDGANLPQHRWTTNESRRTPDEVMVPSPEMLAAITSPTPPAEKGEAHPWIPVAEVQRWPAENEHVLIRHNDGRRRVGWRCVGAGTNWWTDGVYIWAPDHPYKPFEWMPLPDAAPTPAQGEAPAPDPYTEEAARELLPPGKKWDDIAGYSGGVMPYTYRQVFSLTVDTDEPASPSPAPAGGEGAAAKGSGAIGFLGELAQEYRHGRQKWGGRNPDAHDGSHAASDWEKFIWEKVAQAASGTPMEWRHRMLQVASLAMSACLSFDRRAALSSALAAASDGGNGGGR